MATTDLVFLAHTPDWARLAGNPLFFQDGKQALLFLAMVALVGKVSDEIHRPLVKLKGNLLIGSSGESGEDLLNDAVLIHELLDGV
jgi:hypothetical protein